MDRPLKHITRDETPTVNLEEERSKRSWEWVLMSAAKEPDVPLQVLDTVFLHNGEVTAWFFTSRDGVLLRKAGKNLTLGNVAQQFIKIAVAYENNAHSYAAVLWREGAMDCEMITVNELSTTLESASKGSASVNAYAHLKGEVHPTRYATYEHEYMINKNGKVQTKSSRFALGAQRIPCMDMQLNQAMNQAATQLLTAVEKHRKCRIVVCNLYFVVDDKGYLYLVKTSLCETTPLSATKPKKTITPVNNSAAIGPSATTQRMLDRAKLEELNAPDEAAIQAIMQSKSKNNKQGRLASLPKQRIASPPNNNHVSTGKLLSRMERRAISALNLGSSQKKGCTGDYCCIVVDPAQRIQRSSTPSLLGFPKGNKTLAARAEKYEQKAQTFIESLESSASTSQTTETQDIWAQLTVKSSATPTPNHKIPFKYIAQTRAEKQHVEHYIRRYANGEDVEYAGLLYDDGGDGEPLGEAFPGYYYQDVDVCANCFAFYNLIEDARVKAKSRLAAKRKLKKGKSMENVGNGLEKVLEPWQIAWNEAVAIAKSITVFEIAELRSFVHPPPAIAMVASVLLILLVKKEHFLERSYTCDLSAEVRQHWAEVKRELTHSDKLYTMLQSCTINSFDQEQVKRALVYTSNTLYSSEVIQPIWKGAAKLCEWSKAALRAYALWQPAITPAPEPLADPPPSKSMVKAVLQNRQMARLAGQRLEPEVDPNLSHEFICRDGTTSILYQVLGMGGVALNKSNLIVWQDFFDTIDSTKVFLRSIVTAHQGCQILLFNLPGQANTRFGSTEELNNIYLTQCVYELLQELNQTSKFLLSVPFHIVGFGQGGNLAACFAIQFGHLLGPAFQSLVVINGFASIDPQLAGILHGAVNLFSCLPHTRPDLPVSYFSKFLFSDSYLSRVDPNLALSIYTAVTNSISLEGRLRICKGALHHVDLVKQLKEITVPLVVVQSVENVLVAPTNVDPFIEGRSCVHVWSHQQGKKGELNQRSRELLAQTLSHPEKSAFVSWLRAGHEVRQEAKTYICDLLNMLVAWPEPLTPSANVAPKEVAKRESPQESIQIAPLEPPQEAQKEIPEAPLQGSKVEVRSNDTSVPEKDQKSIVFEALAAPAPAIPQAIVAPPTNQYIEDQTFYYEEEAKAAQERLNQQILTAEANAKKRKEQEKADAEARLTALRLEQARRRKQWEDEDNARLAALEQELRGRKSDRVHSEQILQDQHWEEDVAIAKELEDSEPYPQRANLPPGLVTPFEIPEAIVDISQELLKATTVPAITSMFDELEAEEERKRKIGVLKVEEYEHIQKQMALAEAERQKLLDHERIKALAFLHEKKALKIQTCIRRYLAQCQLAHLRTKRREMIQRNIAGGHIVRVARGAISRRRTKAYKQRKVEMEKYLASTELIQRWYRGATTRKMYHAKRRQKYALVLQRVYRGYRGRKLCQRIRDSQAHVKFLHRTATKLQATYKMHREKEKYLSSRVRTLAANEIQRVYRGHLGRKRVERMQEWDRAEPGPEKLTLGLKRIEASKAEFERQQKEIDALHRAQESAELKISEIHASLSDAQKELAVLERELQEIDQIETDLHELTHEAEMLKTRGVENADRQGLGNGIVLNQPQNNGGFETKEEARKRQAEAYALEMAIHIKRNEREKKKNELEAEFTSVFQDVQAKKQALEDMEAKLSDMEATRLRKDREFARMQRNLMELLEEQKYELDMIREKGIELETATATSAAAAAATAMKAKEHEKKSQAIFESTEELMKFQFMSMSLSYFSSLNMLKSLRDINADTTAAAISSTAETAATAAAAAAAANIPTMQRLQVGSNELMDAASKKKKLELQERQKREDEAKAALLQPFPTAMRDWSIDDIQRWLDVLSLPQYKQAFREGAVDGALLLELRPEDLSEILGVSHKAHLLKILVSRKKYLPLSQQEKVKYEAAVREDEADKNRKGVPDTDTVFSQARNGRFKRLVDSVEAGFDVNTEDEKGNTLLSIASQNVNQKMVEFLVLKGANVNHKNAQGNTPLHFAMAYDKDGVLGEYLIGHGADDTIENIFGLSPYDGISAD